MSRQHLTSVEPREIRLLHAAVNALDIDETAGEALFLTVCRGAREWMVESSRGQLHAFIRDRDCTLETLTQFALSDRVRLFAEYLDNQPLSLSLADDATVVATAGPASAAIDVVDTPGHRREVHPFTATAEAVVTVRQFIALLGAARCLPAGISDITYPTPPMWFGIADGTIGLHIDWRDFLPSRATYRLAWLRGYGSVTVPIPHRVIDDFLQYVPIDHDITGELDDDMEMSIETGHCTRGDHTRPAVRLSAAEWSIVLYHDDYLLDRWADRIDAEIATSDIEILDHQGPEWMVRQHGTRVRLILHPGHPDVVRVSAVLLEGVDESIELLRELGQLNAASTTVRHWLDDGTVHVAADVPCSSLSTLATTIREVARAVQTYAPMLSMF